MTHKGRMGVLGAAVVAIVVAAGAALAGGDANLLPPLSDQGAWSVADYGGLEVGIGERPARRPDTFAARIFKIDGTDWHASIDERKPVKLVDGHRYTLTLLASANTLRNIRVLALSTARDGHNIGLDATLPIGFGNTAFSVSFVAHDTGGQPARIRFAVGQTTGLVELQSLRLVDNGPDASNLRTL